MKVQPVLKQLSSSQHSLPFSSVGKARIDRHLLHNGDEASTSSDSTSVTILKCRVGLFHVSSILLYFVSDSKAPRKQCLSLDVRLLDLLTST